MAVANSNMVDFDANSLFVDAPIVCMDSVLGLRSAIYFNIAQIKKLQEMYPFP